MNSKTESHVKFQKNKVARVSDLNNNNNNMRILPDHLDIISDDELLELANSEGIDVSAIIDATDESAGAEEETEEGLPPLWSEDFR